MSASKARSVLVYTTPSQFHVIPKRVFPTPELVTTMRQLLSDRVAPGGQVAIDACARTAWIPLAANYVVLTLVIAGFFEALARAAAGW